MEPSDPDTPPKRHGLRVIDGGRRGSTRVIQLFCEGRLDEVDAEIERMERARAGIRVVREPDAPSDDEGKQPRDT